MSTAVDMPPRVAALARDHRGLPIPYAVAWPEGKPDFRIMDPDKWGKAVRFRRCGICGVALGRHVAFVGGRNSIINRLFTDLPMHRECAEYALRVCPFLAAPKFAYAKRLPSDTQVNAAVSTERPEVFGLGMTREFHPVRMPAGDVVLRADPFLSVEWWRQGAPYTPDTQTV